MQIPDVFPLLAAAHKTLVAKSRESLTTRTLHSELVYNYSASKHVGYCFFTLIFILSLLVCTIVTLDILLLLDIRILKEVWNFWYNNIHSRSSLQCISGGGIFFFSRNHSVLLKMRAVANVWMLKIQFHISTNFIIHYEHYIKSIINQKYHKWR